MGIRLPETIILICDLYKEEAVQSFEVLQDAGFKIAVGHYKDSATWSVPRVYAGEYSYQGLEGIKHFAKIFGPIAREQRSKKHASLNAG